MTWEETIKSIREKPGFETIVKDSYYESDLKRNIESFGKSKEFKETVSLIKKYLPGAKTILDIGAGNGISSVNFALTGFAVSAVEPDASDTVGANAIRQLQSLYNLNNLFVYESIAEELSFDTNSFDVVYIRQAMHHAHDLEKFVYECARVLKPGGILLTVRDHVIFDQTDKELFLESHPLHKFYCGENAFTAKEYKTAMKNAGLKVVKEIKYYDSVINYFPSTYESIKQLERDMEIKLKTSLKNKLGSLSQLPFIYYLYKLKNHFAGSVLNEKLVPGRMYSYIAKKV